MYATKVGKYPNKYYGNFGMECTGGEEIMNWQNLGPELTPDQFHAVWNKGNPEYVSSLHVYKIFEPKSQLWVVANVNVCFNHGYTSCSGPGNPPPHCSTSMPPVDTATCKVENTFAPAGKKLFYWHTKAMITNATNVRTPGVLLEFQASEKPWPSAPKSNVGYPTYPGPHEIPTSSLRTA